MPLFSTIIPCYNRADLVPATLETVLAQRCQDNQIIVVDDGSKDDLDTALKPFAGRFELVRQENKGLSAARNAGIRHATGDYLVFLDSDDLWFPWTLDTFRRIIESHQAPSVIAGDAEPFHELSELDKVTELPIDVTVYRDYLHAGGRVTWLPVGALAIKRQAFEQTTGFAEHRVGQEDIDMWIKLGASPGFVWINAPKLMGRRWHTTNLSWDVTRNVDGVHYLIDSEHKGLYPGDAAYQRHRARIITSSARSATIDCYRKRQPAQGWRLYRRTFLWNLQLRRFRYLAAYPFMALAATCLPRRGR